MIEIARHYKEGPVKRKDIARSQGISSAYLECVDTDDACKQSSACAARWLWNKIYNAQMSVLKKTTLQALVDLADSEKQIDYSI